LRRIRKVIPKPGPHLSHRRAIGFDHGVNARTARLGAKARMTRQVRQAG
jgi:hypothetical protein